jgi:ABC-type antimicrobial peptide transport system permease subunit
LLTGFGGVALLLAMLGIYGTLAYAVSRRRQEFGIRMALGSDRPALMLFVLRRAFAPIAIGVAGGIGMGVAATRWMQSLLYHTPPTDPAVIVFSAGAVLLAGLLATLLPARRAARVDPMQALREG